MSGYAFNPDFSYFVQLDGRSSSGNDLRLLDYYLSYDFGHDQFGLDSGTIGFRTGQFKMPFTMARCLSGKEFEFADRSVASMFFDVNRSGSTEFNTPRVIDSGSTLATILPAAVNSYEISQFAVDALVKLHVWSTTRTMMEPPSIRQRST